MFRFLLCCFPWNHKLHHVRDENMKPFVPDFTPLNI